MSWSSAALDPHRYVTASFRSGVPDLDTWLSRHAPAAEARRVSRTFVWCPGVEAGSDDIRNDVVAYYSLAGHGLRRDTLPRSVGRGSPTEVPAVLLARLALDTQLHGQGLGGVLLADALARVVAATALVAARFVVVDALHEKAATFYEHHGFRRIPDTLRLVQKISDVAAALAVR